MTDPNNLAEKIFPKTSADTFESVALEVFNFQALKCDVYKSYLKLLSIDPATITNINTIPFLPIEIFKTHKIISDNYKTEKIFESSGTGGERSKHHLASLDVYNTSLRKSFEHFYGDISNFHILALLPSYYANKNSSLLYMVNEWMKMNKQHVENSFLSNAEELKHEIENYTGDKKILLIGVSHSLLDFAEKYSISKPGLIVMETGGMKGMRKEIIRDDLHQLLKKAFGVSEIHSEYGMTELLSQCYSKKDGVFETPPWVKIIIRDTNDPFNQLNNNITGGINIIDLANIYSCSFVATQDLGKNLSNNKFEMLGRFDNSDIRGCNLLITNQ